MEIEVEKVLNVNGFSVIITRVIEEDYEGAWYYNYLSVEIPRLGLKLVKRDSRRGFDVIVIDENGYYRLHRSRGHKKKLLSALRRALGMSKKEFCRFMGVLGGFW